MAVLVGREGELQALMAAFDAAVGGEPAVVLVGGEAGVGKTRLVEEAAARARAAGARVLLGGCVELGEGVPLMPLADALRALMREAGPEQLDAFLGPARVELARLVPELAAQALPAAPAEPARLLELMLGVIQRLAADRPLVFVIEDLHWGDRATLDLVTLLVRALRGVRVLLVVTFRSDEVHRGHPLRPLVSGWERVRAVRRIELSRFSAEEVARQLEGLLGEPASRRLVELVFARSEGNAFLVEEILGVVQSGAGPDQLPETLRDVLLARAERLSATTQRLLRVAAAGGRSVPDRLLAAVAGLDDAALDAALQEAIEHRLLVVDEPGHGYLFRHALTRDAVYADTLPRERVRIHGAYALALSTDPGLAGGAGAAPALALHWSAAHDLPRALPACLDAARQATAYAPAEALRLLERALEWWPQVADAQERCGVDVAEVLRRAGLAAYAAGELDRSLALLEEALEELGADSEPERRAVLLDAHVAALLDLGRQDEATAELEQAAALLPAEPPTVTRALVLASLANRRMLSGDFEAGCAASERAVAAARAAHARDHEAHALITLGVSRSYLGDSEEGVRLMREGIKLAEADGSHTVALRGILNLSDSLELTGDHEGAVRQARRGLELAERSGMTRNVIGVYLTYNLAESLFHTGRWDESARTLTEALDTDIAGPFAGLLLQLRGRIHVLKGRFAEAEADLVAAGRLRTNDDDQFVLQLELSRAELARMRGDLATARELVRAALAGTRRDARYVWPLVWGGIRLEAEAGEPDLHRVRALRELAESLPAVTPAARTFHALSVNEAARLTGAPADWAAAAAICREANEPGLLVFARMRQAESAWEAGDSEQAEVALGETVRLAALVDARPALAAARALARRTGLRVESANGDADFGLTARELEVLTLLAAGRSNPQIAAELFISPKTASVHVSNILGKLNAAGRGEAAAIAHRHGIGRPG